MYVVIGIMIYLDKEKMMSRLPGRHESERLIRRQDAIERLRLLPREKVEEAYEGDRLSGCTSVELAEIMDMLHEAGITPSVLSTAKALAILG